jgi:hypothetical protein
LDDARRNRHRVANRGGVLHFGRASPDISHKLMMQILKYRRLAIIK